MTGLDVSPAQLNLNRGIRTKLPVTKEALKPKIQRGIHKKVLDKQTKTKEYYDRTARSNPGEWEIGDQVLHQNKH